MYAIHFGAYPDGDTVTIDGHADPKTEHEVTLGFLLAEAQRAFVSGSWACWGPADQDTDGDDSLHVVVEVENLSPALALGLRDAIYEIGSADFRLLDYAVVTTEDWSEVVAVATFTGNPECVVFKVAS